MITLFKLYVDINLVKKYLNYLKYLANRTRTNNVDWLGFHKATLAEILLKLNFLTLDISFNFNNTALKLCLPVKQNVSQANTILVQ